MSSIAWFFPIATFLWYFPDPLHLSVAVAIVEGHRQRIENNRLIMSLYIERLFKILNVY